MGSGYVSVELGGVLAALGAEVTILTRFDGVLRSFDALLREALAGALAADGIVVEQQAVPAGLSREADGLCIETVDGRRWRGLDSVIWAVGRRSRESGSTTLDMVGSSPR